MINHVALPRHFTIGAGAALAVGEMCTRLGVTRPLLVTDRYLTDSGQVDRLVGALQEAGCEAHVFADTVPDPTASSLQPGLTQLRAHRADSVIGFGGGSPMDTAKALAVLAACDEPIAAFKAPRSYTGPALPVIAIPTTAGSGSEATQFTVITDEATDEKMLCTGPSFLPTATLVDFELTMSMPARLTADTGVDALTHALEAYVSRKANPFSDALALRAMSSINAHLRRVYRDGEDREAREHLMSGAMLAGMAFSNSSVALVHGMSRPIGGHFHVAHGLSNAMLLPAVTRFSVSAATTRYAECARAMGVSAAGADDTAAAELVDALDALCHDVAVPTPHAYGIAEEAWTSRVEVMAEQALASGSPANNPRVPSAEEIVGLYHSIYR